MGLFRKGLSAHHTGLAMVGVKPGKMAVVVGAADGTFAAELALITGLNGRTLVVDRDDAARATVESASAEAGALVEFEAAPATRLPVETESVDVVVLNGELGARPEEHEAIAHEAVRVIRPGGRVVALEGRPRKGLLARLGRSSGPPPVPSEVVRTLLAATELRAVRVLDEVDGVTYVEGVKARP